MVGVSSRAQVDAEIKQVDNKLINADLLRSQRVVPRAGGLVGLVNHQLA